LPRNKKLRFWSGFLQQFFILTAILQGEEGVSYLNGYSRNQCGTEIVSIHQ
jgi:hypothetical protein